MFSLYEIAVVLVIVFFVFLVIGMIYPHMLVTEEYEICSSHLSANRRFVLLTDLHGCMHGQKNSKLLHMIEKAQPDFICIAGDMTVKNGHHTDEMTELVQQLCRTYPVYYSSGNHEKKMPAADDYKEKLKEAGVCYLENESIAIEGNIVIYGLDLPEQWYHKFWQRREMKAEHLEQLLGVCREDCFTLLLAHNPEYAEQYAAWGADLTVSGHVHGGIMRLPLLGGVIAPSLRLFPKFDAGLYSFREGRAMIVSRGLGLHHIKLRFFNRPEVSVINLSCQKTGR